MQAELEALEREHVSVGRMLARRRGEAEALIRQARESAAEAKEQAALASSLEKACTVLSKYADARQEDVRKKLEGLVSHGLQTVFQEDLSLVLKVRQVGKRTDTDLVIRSVYGSEEIETPILEARGGGVAAVTGFLLQVIMILLHDAPRIIFLDESFAQVSAEYEPRLAEFISELADAYQMQFVVVTHSQTQAWSEISDKVYRTSIKDGKTAYTEVPAGSGPVSY